VKRAIQSLEGVTADLHAGAAPSGWSDATAASQGGVGAVDGVPNLAKARAVQSWPVSLSSGIVEKYLVARIPSNKNPAEYRVEITGSDAQLYEQPLTGMTFLGLTSDGSWRLYGYQTNSLGDDDASIQLQVTGSAAHVGTSVFGGELSGLSIVGAAQLEAAVLARIAPALTGQGGKFLAVNSGATAVELVDKPSGGGALRLIDTFTLPNPGTSTSWESAMTRGQLRAILRSLSLAVIFEPLDGYGSGPLVVGAHIPSDTTATYRVGTTVMWSQSLTPQRIDLVGGATEGGKPSIRINGGGLRPHRVYTTLQLWGA